MTKKTFAQMSVKWAFIVGIAIVLNLFFNYALSVFYPAPKYENFCKEDVYARDVSTPELCTEAGGWWIDEPIRPEPVVEEGEKVTTGYCDITYVCREVYENTRDPYNRNIFIILVVLGVVALGVGTYLKKNDVISAGLSYGGVLSLIIGSFRFWPSANDVIRLVILAVALLALILLALDKFRDEN